MRLVQSVLLMAVLPLVAVAELPEQLRHLEEIADDEKAAVDAMRNFQLLQEHLITWDSELAAQYMDSGERVLAEAKAEDLRRRIAAVEAGWEYLLRKYPENPRIHTYYGEHLFDHTRERANGVQHWQHAIALEPDFAPAHNNLGMHYLHSGSAKLGLQHLHTAIELDPKNVDYLFNITQAYLNYRREVQRYYQKDLKEVYAAAMEFSRRAAELAPDDLEVVQDYAVNFYAAPDFGVKPDWNAAAAAWEKAFAVAISSVDRFYTLLNKARVMIRMEKWPEAVALLEQSLAIMPDSELAANLLAQCREELDQSQKKGRKDKKRSDEPS